MDQVLKVRSKFRHLAQELQVKLVFEQAQINPLSYVSLKSDTSVTNFMPKSSNEPEIQLFDDKDQLLKSGIEIFELLH